MQSKNSIAHSLEIIENQISEKLTVGHIAGSVHFSKFHYQRLFREMVGESVMEYVIKRKLTLAGKELLETDAAVVDIAIKFGYDSREGFSRSFKAFMGVTPGEYRKYSLSAIAQKTVKESGKMTYSKTTNEIIRELNDFIVKAKETASLARKEKAPGYEAFWGVIAETTDSLANRVQSALERITAIAERPDEITNRFSILRVLTDNAFESNLLAFNVGLMVSRAFPEHEAVQNSMYKKYHSLAATAQLKASKIAEFFNELSALISEDIKKSYDEKIQQVVEVAKPAIASIVGYENIKFELGNVVEWLEQIPFDEKTVLHLNDCVFRLNIILFAADMDITRSPHDRVMFEGLAVFKNALSEAIEFADALPKGVSTTIKSEPQKRIQDFAFQGNILLFYLRGEAEKLEKIDEFNAVYEKINKAIQIAHSATEATAAKEISHYYGIAADEMNRLADGLGLHGNPIKFLAAETKTLANHALGE
jgi:AraC family transcriptional regulator